MEKTFVICVASRPSGILVLLAFTIFQGESLDTLLIFIIKLHILFLFGQSIYTLEIVPSIVI
jgi:hypothetical protein